MTSDMPKRKKCFNCGCEKTLVCSDRKNAHGEYPHYVECTSCKNVSIFGETELEAINHWNEMSNWHGLIVDQNNRDCLNYNVSSDSVIKKQTAPPKTEIMGIRILPCVNCGVNATNNINMVVDYVTHGMAMHSMQCINCGRQSSWRDTFTKSITAWNTELVCNWRGTSQMPSLKPSPATDQTPIPRPIYDYGEQPEQSKQPPTPASTPEPTPEPASLPEITTAVTSSDSGDKTTTITVNMDKDTCKMVREIRIEFNGP